MTTSPRVAVVVCVRNGERELPTLFEGLRRQTFPLDEAELVVVDDASTDGTAALAEAEPGVRLIRCAEPVGLPRARNIGMADTSAPIIALTDCDTILDSRWLELGVERFDDPEVDLLGGSVTVPLGDRPNLATLLDVAAHFNQADYVRRGFSVGANMWLRRTVIDRVGGFSEDIAAYGGDDNEFGQRATGSGAKLVYAPEVALEHPPRDSLRELVRKRYKLGYCLAGHRRHNPGPLGQTPLLFLQRGAYRPRAAGLPLQRLLDAGYRPDRRRRQWLVLGAWLFLQLPRMYGDLRGELDFRRHGHA